MFGSFFVRGPDGRIELRLPEGLAEALVFVFDDMASFMEAPVPGEVTDRLFPRAYLDPTEEEAEREWQSAVHGDLAAERSRGARDVVRDLQEAPRAGGGIVCTLTDEEAENRWVMVLNDARLAIGTTLGVTADGPESFPSDDPRAAALEVYHLLTELQDDLVTVLVAELPEEGTEGHGPF